MKQKKILSFTVVILIAIIFNYFLIQNEKLGSRAPKGELGSQVSGIKFVKIAGEIVKVELAETPEVQARGLSGRKNLGEDEGMLFIFSEPKINYFWMKEMKFPIDIIWIDENFLIIFIEQSVEPGSYPNSFGPEQKSKYVLEISAGFSEKNNLQVNDHVQFLP